MKPPGTLPRPGSLDPASRRVLARLCFTVGWFGIIAFTPVLAGLSLRAHAVAAFGTYCSFAALLRVFLAARNSERPCAATLNGWDECLALVAAAMLAYAAARLVV